MAKIKIYVMTHKKFNMPSDDVYTPLFVGVTGKNDFGYLRDDTGDNISHKNNLYSEITGLYWVWKNSNEDIIGLDHYKRYFAKGKLGNKGIIDKHTILEELKTHDIILHHRKQGITNYNMFKIFVKEENIKKSCDIMKKIHPDYYEDYINTLKRRSLHPYNMFIAKKNFVDLYCSWLFEYLKALEEELELNPRVIGYFTELTLETYVTHNNLTVKNYPLYVKNLDINLCIDLNTPFLDLNKKLNINLTALFNLFFSKSHLIMGIVAKSQNIFNKKRYEE